ncbi:hypothetical protein C1H46_045209 [Malus baccata]|uniref:Uncharacterized protein n=1 Tax=Malus baccata TaxID=106549 RepID=A0A540K4V2_MALBA|nr:hypothetical protein C1H46_045209 [Malus baccata]
MVFRGEAADNGVIEAQKNGKFADSNPPVEVVINLTYVCACSWKSVMWENAQESDTNST